MLLLARSNDFGICCLVVLAAMVVGGLISSAMNRRAVARKLAQDRTARATERARYNRIKVQEAQARGQGVTLCELCGGTGTWQGRPEEAQECPRCFGLGLVAEADDAGATRCPRCRHPLTVRDAAFCANCGLALDRHA